MDMDPYTAPDSGFNDDQPDNPVTRRIALLPMWVMLLNWIYLFLGILSIIAFAAIMIAPLFDVFLRVAPFTDSGAWWDVMMLFVLPPALSIGAYGLLYGKAWGVKFALAAAYLGLLLSLWPYFQTVASESLLTGWHLFITAFYLYTLHTIQRHWHGGQLEREKAADV